MVVSKDRLPYLHTVPDQYLEEVRTYYSDALVIALLAHYADYTAWHHYLCELPTRLSLLVTP